MFRHSTPTLGSSSIMRVVLALFVQKSQTNAKQKTIAYSWVELMALMALMALMELMAVLSALGSQLMALVELMAADL